MDFRELIEFREYKSQRMKKFLGLFDLFESIADPNVYQPLEESIGIDLRQSSLLQFDNGLILSVFGSNTAYCTPRKNVGAYDYTTLEIAFYYLNDKDRRGSDFLELTVQTELEDFNKKQVLGEFFHKGVYRCVPINLIQEVFDFLEAKYSLITINKEIKR